MIIRKTFEQWLQQFHKDIWIDEIGNVDVDVLMMKDKRLGSIPKGLKNTSAWTDIINDSREDEDYVTSDGIKHRSLSGVGLLLLQQNAITPKQFIENFTTERTKKEFIKLALGPMAEHVKFLD